VTSKGLRRAASDVTGTFVTRLVTIGFGVFTGIITARALGPENRGIFTLVALFPASVVTLIKLGQGIAAVYFIRREKESVSRVASNVLLIGLLMGAALMVLLYPMKGWLLDTILRGVPGWALIAVLPLIPVLLIESHLYGVLQATDRFRVYNTRLIAEAILTVSGMALVLLMMHWGLRGALAVVVSVRIVMLTWLVFTIHRESPLRLSFDGGLFRRMIGYGLQSHVQIIASHFHFKADLYLVAYYLDPAQVAFYSIAARLAEHMMHLPQTLGMVMFPRLAGSDQSRAHMITATACRQTLAITAVSAALLVLLGRFLIVTWYGADYAPAAAPLPFVAAGIVMMSVYVLLSRNFTSHNRQGVNIFAAYLALGGNLALNFLLIPRFGIVGAAVSTLTSYSASSVILFVMFLRESGMAWHDVLILKPADLAMWRRLAAGAWADARRRSPARA
jgi:O-antigen/teichoic acid export membrane protein